MPPILLGFVLGPLIEENFRRALLLSHGDMAVFIQQPISAVFIAISALLIVLQTYFSTRSRGERRKQTAEARKTNRPATP
jgi:TctA family transporter